MASNYNILFTKKAESSLERLSKPDIVKTLKKIHEFLPNFSPQTPNIKQLKGTTTPCYHLRIGNIRVLFELESQTIWILDIGYRGNIY
jgi:mRNA-degrading endonuclease RelE of RelBE toxin-antitoxin system